MNIAVQLPDEDESLEVDDVGLQRCRERHGLEEIIIVVKAQDHHWPGS